MELWDLREPRVMPALQEPQDRWDPLVPLDERVRRDLLASKERPELRDLLVLLDLSVLKERLDLLDLRDQKGLLELTDPQDPLGQEVLRALMATKERLVVRAVTDPLDPQDLLESLVL